MPINKLSAAQVRNAKPRERTYRLGDGNGLYLLVQPGGSKSWMQRLVIHGRRVDMGLGSLDYTTLADARETAAENRKLARGGQDPRTKRGMTFAEAFYQYVDGHRRNWRGSRTETILTQRMDNHALPRIGNVPVDQIMGPHIRSALTPLFECGKVTTAKKLGGEIGQVLDFAISMGWRVDASPTTSILKQFRNNPPPVKHKALPFDKVGEAIRSMQSSATDLVADAFTFQVLTAARTGEVRKATWDEIDMLAGVWTIPAPRMKAGKKHTVPLSKQAKAILGRRLAARTGRYVFPGTTGGPLGEGTIRKAVKTAEIPAVPHGFRSSFVDWCRHNEVDPDAREMALAHSVGDATVQAYARSDLLDLRKPIMQKWADYLMRPTLDSVFDF